MPCQSSKVKNSTIILFEISAFHISCFGGGGYWLYLAVAHCEDAKNIFSSYSAIFVLSLSSSDFERFLFDSLLLSIGLSVFLSSSSFVVVVSIEFLCHEAYTIYTPPSLLSLMTSSTLFTPHYHHYRQQQRHSNCGTYGWVELGCDLVDTADQANGFCSSKVLTITPHHVSVFSFISTCPLFSPLFSRSRVCRCRNL